MITKILSVNRLSRKSCQSIDFHEKIMSVNWNWKSNFTNILTVNSFLRIFDHLVSQPISIKILSVNWFLWENFSPSIFTILPINRFSMSSSTRKSTFTKILSVKRFSRTFCQSFVFQVFTIILLVNQFSRTFC